jgi:hypothetical protein
MPCEHIHTVSTSDGDVSCTACGLVVDRVELSLLGYGVETNPVPLKYLARCRRVAASIHLPDRFVEYAASLLDTRVRVTDIDILAALYASCFVHGVPRTEKELASIYDVPLKTLSRKISSFRRSGIIPPVRINIESMIGRRLGPTDSTTMKRMVTLCRHESIYRANLTPDTQFDLCCRQLDRSLESREQHQGI